MTAFYRNLFRSRPADGVPTVPAGYRVYAVGDVHGRADLLDELLGAIRTDCDRRGRAKTILVFLGDYIDRGPQSAEVVERLRTLKLSGIRPVYLCGNHEEVLLRLLAGDSGLVDDWLRFGGAECIASYGLDPEAVKEMGRTEALARIRTAVPRDHHKFLQSLGDTFLVGDYLFVHAGIRPGIALDEQSQQDLRWIREPFLDTEDAHGFVVVHGHTISEQVEIRSNRIGIDTGAYRTGVLTALGLERDRRWFLHSGEQGVSVADPASAATD